jgi:hypothetical protein
MSLNGRLLIRFVEEHAGSLAASLLIRYLIQLYENDEKYGYGIDLSKQVPSLNVGKKAEDENYEKYHYGIDLSKQVPSSNIGKKAEDRPYKFYSSGFVPPTP